MSQTPSPSDAVSKLGKQMAAFIEKSQTRYRRLRAFASLLVVVFSLILGSIIGSFIPLNSSVVSLASQSLVGVDGFLAAASGVIAFFYSGRLLEFASPTSPLMLALRPILKAESEGAKKEMETGMQALAQKLDLSRTLSPEELSQGQKALFDVLGAGIQHAFEGTGKLVGEMSSPARRMACDAGFVLIVLVVSAFFSILGILSASAPYLGTAFGFTVLGSGFLALAWSDAHVSLIRSLTMVQMHESMMSSFVPQGTG